MQGTGDHLFGGTDLVDDGLIIIRVQTEKVFRRNFPAGLLFGMAVGNDKIFQCLFYCWFVDQGHQTAGITVYLRALVSQAQKRLPGQRSPHTPDIQLPETGAVKEISGRGRGNQNSGTPDRGILISHKQNGAHGIKMGTLFRGGFGGKCFL